MTEEIKTETKNEQTIDAAPIKGLLGTKVGMTRVFVSETVNVAVTVISAEGLVVSQIKTKATDGYNAIQIGYGATLERKMSKAEFQHLSKKGVKPVRQLHEFKVSDTAPYKVGQPVPVSVFAKGEKVKVSGLMKGKGYAGVVKRHGFGGLPFSHGHGEYRNRPGSSGAQGPQHVLPGTRKPGNLGHVWMSVKNVEVVDVDTDKNLILIKGSVPGPNGNLIVITPAKRATAKA